VLRKMEQCAHVSRNEVIARLDGPTKTHNNKKEEGNKEGADGREREMQGEVDESVY